MAEPPQMNFCPVCATPLTDGEKGGKKRRVCPNCNFIHFQDPKVAAAVFIVDEDRVLLVRRRVAPRKGYWSLPAGYIDFGEDPREAAIREVKEETGLDVEITGLIDVLGPGGGGQASIVILFEAEVLGGNLTAQDDIDRAVFFAPDDLPMNDLAFSSAREHLERWIAGR